MSDVEADVETVRHGIEMLVTRGVYTKEGTSVYSLAIDRLSALAAGGVRVEALTKALEEARRELVYTEGRLETADSEFAELKEKAVDSRYSDEWVGIAFRAALSRLLRQEGAS